MRAAAAAVALAILTLVAAGCGTSAAGVATGSTAGGDAASLVPADASAFVAVDTNLSSTQWQNVDSLTQSFPARTKLLDRLNTELQKHGVSLKNDVEPALGDEVDVAALGKSDVVAFTKPKDTAKLENLVSKLSTAKEKYTVQQIDGWSVIADSPDLFTRISNVQSGNSLASNAQFKTAWSQVAGDALARVYVNGTSKTPLVDKIQWLAARAWADSNAFRVKAVAHPKTMPTTGAAELLGDAPSGSALAIAFHGSTQLANALSMVPATKGFSVSTLAPLLSGDGVVYVRASGMLPEFAIEVAPKDPKAALAAARGLLQKATGFPVTAQLVNGKVVIADGPAAASALHSGPRLTGDQTFKDAVASAGAPAHPAFIAYADVQTLAPFIQLAAQALTGKAPNPGLVANLQHVASVVAWAAPSGGNLTFGAWIKPQ